MNIYEKMSQITAELTAVAKNLQVGVGKSSYKAAGEADILAAVKPLEEKYGIYSYPIDREIVESAVLTSTSTYNGETTEKKQMFMRLRVVYRFVNTEKPEEFIDVPTYGDGVDPQDKAPGKAMTYADKYALMKAYKIITGEDPDQKASEPLKDKRVRVAVRDDGSEKAIPMASDKQIAFLKKLGQEDPRNAEYIKMNVKSWNTLTMPEATRIIGELKEWKARQD